uniref:Protein preY, mitochondrial n=1 Tax=Xenopus tropicalis TaxID=8364 RepID=A0A6I8S6P6_XENTR
LPPCFIHAVAFYLVYSLLCDSLCCSILYYPQPVQCSIRLGCWGTGKKTCWSPAGQIPSPRALPRSTVTLPQHTAVARSPEQSLKDSKTFDPTLLQFLVCPLSRKSLRYEESTNELINDELGIAYPIVDGIPNMIPQDARMIHKDRKPESPDTEQTT